MRFFNRLNVHLVTVVAEYTSVFPQMLSHYRAMGVDDIIVHAHGLSKDDPGLEKILEAAKRADAQVASVTTGDWALGLNTVFYANTRGKRPKDWFLLADPDEFQVYPDGVKAAIGYCAKKSCNFIEGGFVDRIAEGGRLVDAEPGVSVWDTYPLGGFLTGMVCRGVSNKVVACRGWVRVGAGQHKAFAPRGCPVDDIYIQVHHFKWIAGTVERLKSRIARNSEIIDARYNNECTRFLKHYAKKNRIDVDDLELLIARCGKDYPHWDKIKRLRQAADCFSFS